MNVNREEGYTYAPIVGASAHLVSFTKLTLSLSSLDLLDPATDSMSALCRCVSELCQRAVSVRKGCVQTSGRYVQTTLGSAQTTELSVMFKRAVSVRCVSVHVTETETLRGERM